MPPSRTVSGTVIESTTKTPLTGVSIVVDGTTTVLAANSGARFGVGVNCRTDAWIDGSDGAGSGQVDSLVCLGDVVVVV